jgi:hypothetical protein
MRRFEGNLAANPPMGAIIATRDLLAIGHAVGIVEQHDQAIEPGLVDQQHGIVARGVQMRKVGAKPERALLIPCRHAAAAISGVSDGRSAACHGVAERLIDTERRRPRRERKPGQDQGDQQPPEPATNESDQRLELSRCRAWRGNIGVSSGESRASSADLL